MEQDRTAALQIRKKLGYIGKMLISPEGDRRYVISYPPISYRIRKIETALEEHARY